MPVRRPLLTVLLFFAVPASSAVAGEPETLRVGEPAPSFVLKTMNPERSKTARFVLRDFVGSETKTPKKVVLSFAASYCEPCKRELAEFATMKKAIDEAGAVLAVVVIDTEPEGIAQMKKLTVDELALPFPVLSDRFGVLARRYHATQLPMTVIIAPSGDVQWLSSGFAKGAMAKFRTALGI